MKKPRCNFCDATEEEEILLEAENGSAVICGSCVEAFAQGLAAGEIEEAVTLH